MKLFAIFLVSLVVGESIGESVGESIGESNESPMERRMLKFGGIKIDYTLPPFTLPPTPKPTPQPTKTPTFACTDSLVYTDQVFDFLSDYQVSNQQTVYNRRDGFLHKKIDHGIELLTNLTKRIQDTDVSMSKLTEMFTPFNRISLILSYFNGFHKNNRDVVSALLYQFKQTKELLNQMDLDSIYKTYDELNQVLDELPDVMNRFNKSITDAKNSSDCKDNTRLETRSFNLKTIKEFQPNKWVELDTFLNTVDAKISINLSQVSASVYKITLALDRMINSIGKDMSKGYCCSTPYYLQNTVSFLTGMFNFVNCPIDGIMQATASLQNQYPPDLLNFYHEIYSQFNNLRVQVRPMSHIIVSRIQIQDGLPSYHMETKNIYQHFSSINIQPIPKTIIHVDIINNMGSACRDALMEIGSIGDFHCCRFYMTLEDGEFCDPSNTIPEKHCGICKSDKHEFWVSKFYEACGDEPCFGDGTLCGIGTSCKRCCSGGYSYWFGKAMTACGSEVSYE